MMKYIWQKIVSWICLISFSTGYSFEHGDWGYQRDTRQDQLVFQEKRSMASVISRPRVPLVVPETHITQQPTQTPVSPAPKIAPSLTPKIKELSTTLPSAEMINGEDLVNLSDPANSLFRVNARGTRWAGTNLDGSVWQLDASDTAKRSIGALVRMKFEQDGIKGFIIRTNTGEYVFEYKQNGTTYTKDADIKYTRTGVVAKVKRFRRQETSDGIVYALDPNILTKPVPTILLAAKTANGSTFSIDRYTGRYFVKTKGGKLHEVSVTDTLGRPKITVDTTCTYKEETNSSGARIALYRIDKDKKEHLIWREHTYKGHRGTIRQMQSGVYFFQYQDKDKNTYVMDTAVQAGSLVPTEYRQMIDAKGRVYALDKNTGQPIAFLAMSIKQNGQEIGSISRDSTTGVFFYNNKTTGTLYRVTAMPKLGKESATTVTIDETTPYKRTSERITENGVTVGQTVTLTKTETSGNPVTVYTKTAIKPRTQTGSTEAYKTLCRMLSGYGVPIPTTSGAITIITTVDRTNIFCGNTLIGVYDKKNQMFFKPCNVPVAGTGRTATLEAIAIGADRKPYTAGYIDKRGWIQRKTQLKGMPVETTAMTGAQLLAKYEKDSMLANRAILISTLKQALAGDTHYTVSVVTIPNKTGHRLNVNIMKPSQHSSSPGTFVGSFSIEVSKQKGTTLTDAHILSDTQYFIISGDKLKKGARTIKIGDLVFIASFDVKGNLGFSTNTLDQNTAETAFKALKDAKLAEGFSLGGINNTQNLARANAFFNNTSTQLTGLTFKNRFSKYRITLSHSSIKRGTETEHITQVGITGVPGEKDKKSATVKPYHVRFVKVGNRWGFEASARKLDIAGDAIFSESLMAGGELVADPFALAVLRKKDNWQIVLHRASKDKYLSGLSFILDKTRLEAAYKHKDQGQTLASRIDGEDFSIAITAGGGVEPAHTRVTLPVKRLERILGNDTGWRQFFTIKEGAATVKYGLEAFNSHIQASKISSEDKARLKTLISVEFKNLKSASVVKLDIKDPEDTTLFTYKITSTRDDPTPTVTVEDVRAGLLGILDTRAGDTDINPDGAPTPSISKKEANGIRAGIDSKNANVSKQAIAKLKALLSEQQLKLQERTAVSAEIMDLVQKIKAKVVYVKYGTKICMMRTKTVASGISLIYRYGRLDITYMLGTSGVFIRRQKVLFTSRKRAEAAVRSLSKFFSKVSTGHRPIDYRILNAAGYDKAGNLRPLFLVLARGSKEDKALNSASSLMQEYKTNFFIPDKNTVFAGLFKGKHIYAQISLKKEIDRDIFASPLVKEANRLKEELTKLQASYKKLDTYLALYKDGKMESETMRTVDLEALLPGAIVCEASELSHRFADILKNVDLVRDSVKLVKNPAGTNYILAPYERSVVATIKRKGKHLTLVLPESIANKFLFTNENKPNPYKYQGHTIYSVEKVPVIINGVPQTRWAHYNPYMKSITTLNNTIISRWEEIMKYSPRADVKNGRLKRVRFPAPIVKEIFKKSIVLAPKGRTIVLGDPNSITLPEKGVGSIVHAAGYTASELGSMLNTIELPSQIADLLPQVASGLSTASFEDRRQAITFIKAGSFAGSVEAKMEEARRITFQIQSLEFKLQELGDKLVKVAGIKELQALATGMQQVQVLKIGKTIKDIKTAKDTIAALKDVSLALSPILKNQQTLLGEKRAQLAVLLKKQPNIDPGILAQKQKAIAALQTEVATLASGMRTFATRLKELEGTIAAIEGRQPANQTLQQYNAQHEQLEELRKTLDTLTKAGEPKEDDVIKLSKEFDRITGRGESGIKSSVKLRASISDASALLLDRIALIRSQIKLAPQDAHVLATELKQLRILGLELGKPQLAPLADLQQQIQDIRVEIAALRENRLKLHKEATSAIKLASFLTTRTNMGGLLCSLSEFNTKYAKQADYIPSFSNTIKRMEGYFARYSNNLDMLKLLYSACGNMYSALMRAGYVQYRDNIDNSFWAQRDLVQMIMEKDRAKANGDFHKTLRGAIFHTKLVFQLFDNLDAFRKDAITVDGADVELSIGHIQAVGAIAQLNAKKLKALIGDVANKDHKVTLAVKAVTELAVFYTGAWMLRGAFALGTLWASQAGWLGEAAKDAYYASKGLKLFYYGTGWLRTAKQAEGILKISRLANVLAATGKATLQLGRFGMPFIKLAPGVTNWGWRLYSFCYNAGNGAMLLHRAIHAGIDMSILQGHIIAHDAILAFGGAKDAVKKWLKGWGELDELLFDEMKKRKNAFIYPGSEGFWDTMYDGFFAGVRLAGWMQISLPGEFYTTMLGRIGMRTAGKTIAFMTRPVTGFIKEGGPMRNFLLKYIRRTETAMVYSGFTGMAQQAGYDFLISLNLSRMAATQLSELIFSNLAAFLIPHLPISTKEVLRDVMAKNIGIQHSIRTESLGEVQLTKYIDSLIAKVETAVQKASPTDTAIQKTHFAEAVAGQLRDDYKTGIISKGGEVILKKLAKQTTTKETFKTKITEAVAKQHSYLKHILFTSKAASLTRKASVYTDRAADIMRRNPGAFTLKEALQIAVDVDTTLTNTEREIIMGAIDPTVAEATPLVAQTPGERLLAPDTALQPATLMSVGKRLKLMFSKLKSLHIANDAEAQMLLEKLTASASGKTTTQWPQVHFGKNVSPALKHIFLLVVSGNKTRTAAIKDALSSLNKNASELRIFLSQIAEFGKLYEEVVREALTMEKIGDLSSENLQTVVSAGISRGNEVAIGYALKGNAGKIVAERPKTGDGHTAVTVAELIDGLVDYRQRVKTANLKPQYWTLVPKDILDTKVSVADRHALILLANPTLRNSVTKALEALSVPKGIAEAVKDFASVRDLKETLDTLIPDKDKTTKDAVKALDNADSMDVAVQKLSENKAVRVSVENALAVRSMQNVFVKIGIETCQIIRPQAEAYVKSLKESTKKLNEGVISGEKDAHLKSAAKAHLTAPSIIENAFMLNFKVTETAKEAEVLDYLRPNQTQWDKAIDTVGQTLSGLAKYMLFGGEYKLAEPADGEKVSSDLIGEVARRYADNIRNIWIKSGELHQIRPGQMTFSFVLLLSSISQLRAKEGLAGGFSEEFALDLIRLQCGEGKQPGSIVTANMLYDIARYGYASMGIKANPYAKVIMITETASLVGQVGQDAYWSKELTDGKIFQINEKGDVSMDLAANKSGVLIFSVEGFKSMCLKLEGQFKQIGTATEKDIEVIMPRLKEIETKLESVPGEERQKLAKQLATVSGELLHIPEKLGPNTPKQLAAIQQGTITTIKTIETELKKVGVDISPQVKEIAEGLKKLQQRALAKFEKIVDTSSEVALFKNTAGLLFDEIQTFMRANPTIRSLMADMATAIKEHSEQYQGDSQMLVDVFEKLRTMQFDAMKAPDTYSFDRVGILSKGIKRDGTSSEGLFVTKDAVDTLYDAYKTGPTPEAQKEAFRRIGIEFTGTAVDKDRFGQLCDLVAGAQFANNKELHYHWLDRKIHLKDAFTATVMYNTTPGAQELSYGGRKNITAAVLTLKELAREAGGLQRISAQDMLEIGYKFNNTHQIEVGPQKALEIARTFSGLHGIGYTATIDPVRQTLAACKFNPDRVAALQPEIQVSTTSANLHFVETGEEAAYKERADLVYKRIEAGFEGNAAKRAEYLAKNDYSFDLEVTSRVKAQMFFERMLEMIREEFNAPKDSIKKLEMIREEFNTPKDIIEKIGSQQLLLIRSDRERNWIINELKLELAKLGKDATRERDILSQYLNGVIKIGGLDAEAYKENIDSFAKALKEGDAAKPTLVFAMVGAGLNMFKKLNKGNYKVSIHVFDVFATDTLVQILGRTGTKGRAEKALGKEKRVLDTVYVVPFSREWNAQQREEFFASANKQQYVVKLMYEKANAADRSGAIREMQNASDFSIDKMQAFRQRLLGPFAAYSSIMSVEDLKAHFEEAGIPSDFADKVQTYLKQEGLIYTGDNVAAKGHIYDRGLKALRLAAFYGTEFSDLIKDAGSLVKLIRDVSSRLRNVDIAALSKADLRFIGLELPKVIKEGREHLASDESGAYTYTYAPVMLADKSHFNSQNIPVILANLPKDYRAPALDALSTHVLRQSTVDEALIKDLNDMLDKQAGSQDPRLIKAIHERADLFVRFRQQSGGVKAAEQVGKKFDQAINQLTSIYDSIAQEDMGIVRTGKGYITSTDETKTVPKQVLMKNKELLQKLWDETITPLMRTVSVVRTEFAQGKNAVLQGSIIARAVDVQIERTGVMFEQAHAFYTRLYERFLKQNTGEQPGTFELKYPGSVEAQLGVVPEATGVQLAAKTVKSQRPYQALLHFIDLLKQSGVKHLSNTQQIASAINSVRANWKMDQQELGGALLSYAACVYKRALEEATPKVLTKQASEAVAAGNQAKLRDKTKQGLASLEDIKRHLLTAAGNIGAKNVQGAIEKLGNATADSQTTFYKIAALKVGAKEIADKDDIASISKALESVNPSSNSFAAAVMGEGIYQSWQEELNTVSGPGTGMANATPRRVGEAVAIEEKIGATT